MEQYKNTIFTFWDTILHLLTHLIGKKYALGITGQQCCPIWQTNEAICQDQKPATEVGGTLRQAS